MVYASKWWFIDRLDVSQLTDYAIWLAHYTGASQDDPFAKPSNYGGEYVMWQYTDEGTVNGVLGNVDMNVTIPKNNVGINISNIQSVGTSTENNQDKKVKIFY